MWPLRRAVGEPSFLLVTYDSCRYDAYLEAGTPVLDRYEKPHRAWSQATYTYASHASMFQGILPHAFEDAPLYNRYRRQLWRRVHREVGTPPVVSFPPQVRSVIDGFNRRGYFTCGTGAMAWFKNTPQLKQDWQRFRFTGINARAQVAWTINELRRREGRSFFAFINFGETHAPYRCDSKIIGSEGRAVHRERSPLSLKREDWAFDEPLWRRQVACVEFLDQRMGELLEYFESRRRAVTVIVCGDHGDCFGEDGLWGHGFYHPRVMEVPLLIFEAGRATAS